MVCSPGSILSVTLDPLSPLVTRDPSPAAQSPVCHSNARTTRLPFSRQGQNEVWGAADPCEALAVILHDTASPQIL